MKKGVLTAFMSLCVCAPLCAQTKPEIVKKVGNSTVEINATPEELERTADTLMQNAATMMQSAATMRQAAALMRQAATNMKKSAKTADKVSKNGIKIGARHMEAGARNMEAGARSMETAAMSMNESANELAKDGEERVYDVVEQMPSYPGGQWAMFEYISKNVKYPVEDKENGVQGRVIVTFIVERDGSITSAKVVHSASPALDKEALRIVESMPRWTPGRKNGKPVRVKFTVPVTFTL